MNPIYCVIDRSGSMQTCKTDTIGGFNAFLSEQEPETFISINLFDNEYKELYRGPVKDAEPLSNKTFVPRGSTALLDAIGQTIKKAEGTPIIVILTDGDENSSCMFNTNSIKELIEEKTKLGWKFVFLGANQDAIMTANNFGISKSAALTFSPENVGSAIRSMSSAIKRSRCGQQVEFSQEERQESIASNC